MLRRYPFVFREALVDLGNDLIVQLQDGNRAVVIGIQLGARPFAHGDQGPREFRLVVLVVGNRGGNDNPALGGERLHEPAGSRRRHPEHLLAARKVAEQLAEFLFG